jgi:hypothetical protein
MHEKGNLLGPSFVLSLFRNTVGFLAPFSSCSSFSLASCLPLSSSESPLLTSKGADNKKIKK